MPSNLHEELVDDIRFGFNRFLRINPKYRQDEFWKNPGIMGDRVIFETVYPSAKGINLFGDVYLDLRDGCGPIVVDVGRMEDGKWNHIAVEDGKPIRVLRVGFDKSIWMLNSRDTEIEMDLMAFYRKEFSVAQDRNRDGIESEN